MNHVGISVTDIDVAMAWYHDVLGFVIISTPMDIVVDSSTDMGFLLSQMYPPEMKRVKMGHMAAGNGVGLEFFQFIGPPTQQYNVTPGRDFEYTRAGFFHICVTDPNPEELVQRIIETGGKQISPVLTIFTNETYQAVYCLDPFGNLVEVMSASYEHTLSNRDPKARSIRSSARRIYNDHFIGQDFVKNLLCKLQIHILCLSYFIKSFF
jgi:catechol 2,3-dioxygenase-like lactoylglutathione lyase family enzyme